MGKTKIGRARIAPPARGSRPSSGHAILEVLVGFSALLIGFFGFAQVVVSSSLASRVNYEVTVAKQAARQVIEQLQATEFGEVFAMYNGDPNDDPGWMGTGPGSHFAVEGLDVLADDADGFVGEIRFPTPDDDPGALREDLDMPEVGLPRDLNGDGDALDDASNDYWLLPVVVAVEWETSAGPGRIEFNTLLTRTR